MQQLDANDPKTLNDGRYTLLGILGEGSMGRTYLADGDSGKVAIKALYPSRLATMKDLELFVREAAVLQKLSHPRIPSYVDAFDEGEGEGIRYHLVQEWVDGVTLRRKIVDGVRFSEDEVIRLGHALLKILEYLHTCEPIVVHRDIKPDNVILRAKDGEPTVVDFGAVREVVRLTMGGGSTIIGTYGYMPPEQLMGRALPASDIYSVGVTLLEMLTRQTPKDLHGEDVQRLVAQCNVSEGFRRVLERMCSPSLDDRYDTASHVLADLDAARGGGALVHAGSIEASIVKRAKDEERALKKASTPGIGDLAYYAMLAVLVFAAVAGVSVLYSMITAGFEGAFIAAGSVSGLGLLITLVLLGMRYTHDAWMPPEASWSRTRGKIRKHGNVYSIDDRIMAYKVFYGFRTAGGDFESFVTMQTKDELEDYPVGKEFDVYYPKNKPEWHETQDFVRDPDDAMARLFDPSVRHTPE